MPGSAVLIFADLLAVDLARRGWSRRLGSLLPIPALDPQSLPADIHLFTASPRLPQHGALAAGRCSVHPQVGRTFAARLENAVAHLARLGYDKIVVIGRDCPDLAQSDVTDALRSLDSHRLVLGPDHKGGCYLIALHAADRHLLCGIRWRRNTDCAALRERVGPAEALLLDVRVDLDSTADARLIPRLRDVLERAGMLLCRLTRSPWVPLRHLREARRWQLPPPAAAVI